MRTLPLVLSALALPALVSTAQAKEKSSYTLSTATKTPLVVFEGKTMYVDVDAEVSAIAGACTYATLPLDNDLCPDTESVNPWTDYAEVEMSKLGGEIVLSPGQLTASASANQSREECGWAKSSSMVSAGMSHVALATGSGMVAYSMIQGAHKTQASDSGDVDFNTNCLTSAGGSTSHDTTSTITTHIPFTLTDDALVTATIEFSELVGGSANYDHVLGIRASMGGQTCELETDGTGFPQNCQMLLELEPGDYSLTTRVTLDAWAVSDSWNDPAASTSYTDYVSATVAARRL